MKREGVGSAERELGRIESKKTASSLSRCLGPGKEKQGLVRVSRIWSEKECQGTHSTDHRRKRSVGVEVQSRILRLDVVSSRAVARIAKRAMKRGSMEAKKGELV